jgi:hypothetical protein
MATTPGSAIWTYDARREDMKMDSVKHEELAELKREFRETFPWKREAIVNMAYSVVGVATLVSLSVIAILAAYLGGDPVLWVTIAGFSGLAPILVTRTLVTNSRLQRVQAHAIWMHEELLQLNRMQEESLRAIRMCDELLSVRAAGNEVPPPAAES